MKVVTANLLGDGAVVYLGDNDHWTSDIRCAARFSDENAKPALEAAQSRVTQIADAYLIEVDEHGAPAGRETIRETIRKSGPTVRTDLGYQAGAQS